MQDIVILSLIFFISLFLGSFYNVVALRTLSGEKVTMPPSHCTTCNHRLSPLDLLPVFSWLFLKGKCRYCKTPISPVYPFGEILTAISYTLIIYINGFTWNALIQIILMTIMIIASVSDLKKMEVPDRFFIIGLLLVIPVRLFSGEEVLPYLIGGVGLFVLMYGLFNLGVIGGADVKLYALIGVALGFTPALFSYLFANCVGAVVILPQLIFKKRKREQEIAFVPYMAIGILISYLMAPMIAETVEVIQFLMTNM